MAEPIKVLLVDDERLIRQGLHLMLGMDERLVIVGEAVDGLEAIEQNNLLTPDVILMDIRMPNLDGKEATKRIKADRPQVRILILTTFSDMEHIRQAMRYGASGYLLKDSSPELIAESISTVAKGSFVVHPEVADKLFVQDTSDPSENQESPESYRASVRRMEDFGLSENEIGIISLVAAGLSNREIGEKLYLTEGTVKNKLSVILQKLDLRDRTQLAIFAWKNHLVQQ